MANTAPDVVRLPGDINLGFTSYFDGFFPTKPGFAFGAYPIFESLNEVTGPNGRASPAFNKPKLDIDALALQFIYTLHEYKSGSFGVAWVLPIEHFSSSFGTPGAVLHDNGLGITDNILDLYYQSKPMTSGGRPIFDWRFEFETFLPLGSFNSHNDINQGSGYTSLSPLVAASYLPTPRLEITTRVNYLYNFQTDRAPNPPPSPAFRNGQAGQAIWLNFDSSYEVVPDLSLGVAGYYLTQLTDDKFNGVSVPGARQEALSLGPGFHWKESDRDYLNGNFYMPIESSNRFQGLVIGLQYIRLF